MPSLSCISLPSCSMLLFSSSCSLPPPHSALVPLSSSISVTRCSSSSSICQQQTCSNNGNGGGGGGGVSVFSSSSSFLGKRNSCFQRRMTLRVFATTQERLENDDADDSALVVTDLRELLLPASLPSPTAAAASASDALETRQAQDSQEAQEKHEGVGPSVEEAKEAAGLLHPETKTIPLNKGRGSKVADFLMVYGGLLDRPFGSGATIAAAGDVVIERVQEEIESLRGIEGVDEQILFEILRFVRLLEMDLKLVGAAQKESTLFQRLEQAKKHCRQAVLLANSF